MATYSPKTWADDDAIDASTLNTEFGAIEEVVNNLSDSNISNTALSASKLVSSNFYAVIPLQVGEPGGGAVSTNKNYNVRVPYAATIKSVYFYGDNVTATVTVDVYNEGSSVFSGGVITMPAGADSEMLGTPNQNKSFSAGDELRLVFVVAGGGQTANYLNAMVLFKDTIVA